MTSLYRDFGGLELPTTAADADPSLSATLDPARDILLACFAQAITSELGPAWDAAVSGHERLDGVAVVADTWPGPPTPEAVLQRKGAFPCLFLARDGRGEVGDFSMWQQSLTQQWALHYILSPLDLGDVRKLDGILIAAAKTVILTLASQGHPDYQSGSNILDLCSMSSAKVLSTQQGLAQFEGQSDAPAFHAMTLTIETVELETFDEDGETALQGASFELGTGNVDGILPSLIYARTEDTQQAPFGSPSPLSIGR